jgi:small subunit ribosomal protein S2e
LSSIYVTLVQDEVMKVMPVQKQTTAGQRTRFKAFVAVGDSNGHVGLGVKWCVKFALECVPKFRSCRNSVCSAKEVATAIRGAIINAKMSIVPVRRGYWGNKLGA